MKHYFKAFKNYAIFSGRARRAEYWYFVLFNLLVGWTLLYIETASASQWPYLVYSLIAFLPGLAVAVRRMHDVGKSGWFVLIPIYNLVLACTAGTSGPNDYGPDPLNPDPEFDFEREEQS